MTLAIQPQQDLEAPLPAEAMPGSIAHLKACFEARSTMPNALLVIWVENALDSDDAKDKWLEQFQIVQQLQSACGRCSAVAPIGDNEYAVLMSGTNQCSDLIPRLEQILSRTAAGHLNGDGAQLQCRIGVARTPVDGYDLRDLIARASAAARDLAGSTLGFQFIAERHRAH